MTEAEIVVQAGDGAEPLPLVVVADRDLVQRHARVSAVPAPCWLLTEN